MKVDKFDDVPEYRVEFMVWEDAPAAGVLNTDADEVHKASSQLSSSKSFSATVQMFSGPTRAQVPRGYIEWIGPTSHGMLTLRCRSQRSFL